jgi:hypothetical protein
MRHSLNGTHKHIGHKTKIDIMILDFCSAYVSMWQIFSETSIFEYGNVVCGSVQCGLWRSINYATIYIYISAMNKH